MLKQLMSAGAFAVVLAGCATTKQDREVRIDATSIETAKASYEAMLAQRTQAQQQRLAIAVLLLNMEGVKSAREIATNPSLQTLGIGAIKDKVAGMSADEIITLSSQMKDLHIESVQVIPEGASR